MFEVSFEPQINTPLIDDYKRVLDLALRNKDRKLRNAAISCKNGNTKLHITKKFVDARRNKLKVIYRFEFLTDKELNKLNLDNELLAFPYLNELSNSGISNELRPVIIGFGPAGMFAGLVLARYGICPIIIERGSEMSKRISDIEALKSGSSLVNPESNIQYGEGGAGTFSDGKLYTGVSSGLKAYIGSVFVKHGASKEILYDSHPHIGTDKLRDVVVGIRKEIISLGGTVLFDTKFIGYKYEDGLINSISIENSEGISEIPCRKLILATGHSSRDTFRKLYELGTDMESKPFAVGVRIEHLRSMIDKSQYGIDTFDSNDISAANYKLAVDTKTGKKLYTFCMCPGGEVIAAQSSQDSICTNGMSYFSRDLTNSNAALLVPVNQDDFGSELFSGLEFQEQLERKAFIAAGSSGMAPVTLYGDLVNNKISTSFGEVKASFMPGVKFSNFDDIFPQVILDTIKDGISLMGKKISGFDNPDSILTAVEARSSSPIRITRDKESFVSTNISGLYPCGEGAGYAGGIMSSAIDGINCANALIKSIIESK